MKKLYYIANIRLPTERAHGIQIMEMCKAFAGLGYQVELVVPNRGTSITEDPFVYYDIEPTFRIKRLWCLDTVRWGRIGFWIESLTFSKMAALYALARKGIFYTRDELPALFLKITGKRVAWEAHTGQKNFIVRMIINLGMPVVVITEGLKHLYLSLGAKLGQVLVASDGADIDRFDIDLSREDARKRLGLSMDKKIVLYKGSLIPWKGAGTFAEAMNHVREKNVQAVFIGGTPDDVENLKKQYSDIPTLLILGNRPRKETPIYQKAADILVIPNSAKEDVSKLYTSPMKLFGYMAGDRPIIASDLPSIREILDDTQAYFFASDDAGSLARTIDAVLGNHGEAIVKAHKALEHAESYSWKKRAEKIIDFIQ